ncbi:DUF2442 domain-containing protein [Thermoanaerobacter brockii subsp. lactiethylicus]|jgi:hypothetical protein|uniref:DUF2442 domain-containing protein n=2 Tax=Thermoanaerobacter TaxID=1754 RepID=B0KAY7_THEP3|nr:MULTISPECIES: DUF2442 domain-containing protein [Thermoanaerobacter]ABY93758.1 hypothetical protein Teth39_0085 [Thermoanaerobacter pseudethanolicus ATCC 33223]ADV78722.1 Protein of unknown function DUF2442 [Thermoanaerobacter brockii subsp. finnii Ako-1]HBW58984.1 DUF2442 domain-containing protein [Thermoanaerobacter sp.]
MYKVVSVKPTDDYKLLVTFDNGIVKEYDMKPKLNEWQFELLKSKAFFKAVKVDPGGYGVSWNSEMDLSEYELWKNGKEVNHSLN